MPLFRDGTTGRAHRVSRVHPPRDRSVARRAWSHAEGKATDIGPFATEKPAQTGRQ